MPGSIFDVALTLSLRNYFTGLDGILIGYFQLCVGYFVIVLLLC